VKRLWRDHSLSIILTAIGVTFVGVAVWLVWPVSRDRWFDIASGLGLGTLTVALFYGLAGCFRERNKPED
jgi:thiol:disulfide interchange protein